MTRAKVHSGAATAALFAVAVSVAGCATDTTRGLGGGAATFDAPAAVHESARGAGSELYAATVLERIPVKGRAPKTGYGRDQFGPAWTDHAAGVDAAGNGCGTRDDILRRDLTNADIAAGTGGCVPTPGRLNDPYSGAVIPWQRGPGTSSVVQIDHVVPLSDAWQKGAQHWVPEKRLQFANDPLNLLAVYGRENAAKGDGDAATWLPPVRGYRCLYVARQVAVKDRYGLWVTAPLLGLVDGVGGGPHVGRCFLVDGFGALLVDELRASVAQPVRVAGQVAGVAVFLDVEEAVASWPCDPVGCSTLVLHSH